MLRESDDKLRKKKKKQVARRSWVIRTIEGGRAVAPSFLEDAIDSSILAS
jgi:hypothetical protein